MTFDYAREAAKLSIATQRAYQRGYEDGRKAEGKNGWRVQYAFCNDWDVPEPYGETLPSAEDQLQAAKQGFHLVRRQMFVGEWEDA